MYSKYAAARPEFDIQLAHRADVTPLAAAAPLSLCRWCRCGGEATLPPSRPVESVDLLMPDSGGEDSDVEMGDSVPEGPLENYLTEVAATGTWSSYEDERELLKADRTHTHKHIYI